MYKFKLIFILVLILLSGCVTTGEKFSNTLKPSNDKSLVYVYRPSTPPYLLTPTMRINEVEVAELANKGFFEIYLDPGKYTIHSDWSFGSGVPDGKVTFDTMAGKTYFVLVSTNMSLAAFIPTGNTVMPIFTNEGNIGLVEEAIALSQLATCSRIASFDSKNIIIKPDE